MPHQAIGWFCDDVRQERGNKETFVGVYGDRVTVTTFPGAFKRMTIVARIHLDVEVAVNEIKLFLRTPDGEEGEIANFPLEGMEDGRRATIERGMPYILVSAQATIEPLMISTPGLVQAFLEINGQRQILSSLVVRQRQQPNSSTAAAQPSSQSPSDA